MKGRRLFVVLLVLLVGRTEAHARRGPAPGTYAAALAAWNACFPEGAAVPPFPSVPDEQDFGSDLDVRRTRDGFRVEARWGGSGVEAVYGGLTIDFQPRPCRALWVRDSTYDGALAFRARIGWINRGAPDDRDLRALVAEEARADDPAHGFARAWLTHACPGGADSELTWTRALEGPLAPAQPWHAGAPRPSPATFWSAAALDAIAGHGWPPPSEEEDDLPPGRGPELAGVVVPPIGRARRTFAAAGVELFEAEIPGRNGGRAIALRDPASNRHRWVVVTRGCVQGTTVAWVGALGSRIVGVTHSRHARYAAGDAILVIDVPSGTAWAVRLPEAIRDAALETPGRARASLAGSTLTVRLGRSAATVDLQPLLALIPAAK